MDIFLIFILLLLVGVCARVFQYIVPLLAVAIGSCMRDYTGSRDDTNTRGGSVSFSKKYVHESQKSTDLVHEQSYNDEQMHILNSIYAKTLIAKDLIEYTAGDDKTLLRSIVQSLILTNYNSTGEFFVKEGPTVNIFKAALESNGLEEHYDKLMDLMLTHHTVDSEYLVATISDTDDFLKITLWNTIADAVDTLAPAEISYGEFSMTIPQYRVAMMRRYSNDMDVILAAMRYYCLLPHDHLLLPLNLYKEYIHMGATIEAFSSPFSSQIMRLESIFGTYRYCSIFDQDIVFNSLGNYFTTSLAGKFSIVHPPAVDSILLSAAKKCVQEFQENSSTRFVFYGPDSPTSDYYKLLMGFVNDGSATVQRFLPGEFNYEDINGKLVPNREALMLFRCVGSSASSSTGVSVSSSASANISIGTTTN